jgi:hypothetical protein
MHRHIAETQWYGPPEPATAKEKKRWRAKRGKYEWPYVRVNTPGRGGTLASFFAAVEIGGEPWTVEGDLRASPTGPPILSGVTVEHLRKDREVTGTVLRDIAIARLRDDAFSQFFSRAAALSVGADARVGGFTEAGAAGAERAADEAAKPRRRRPESHYERIARRHTELANKRTRNVLQVLAEEESEREGRVVPRETIRDWVSKATELGFLAKGNRGKAVARPGPRLSGEDVG